MIDGDVPFYAKIFLTHPLQNADFQLYFRS